MSGESGAGVLGHFRACFLILEEIEQAHPVAHVYPPQVLGWEVVAMVS